MNITKHEVRIAPDQFKELIAALKSPDAKLSIIVENANNEAIARAEGDAENKAMNEYLAAEIRNIWDTLETIRVYALAEAGEEGE